MRAHTKRDESLLMWIGFIIRDRDGIWVLENRNRLGHANAMLPKVDSGLARLIPLEARSLRVHTSCAYVNSDDAVMNCQVISRTPGPPTRDPGIHLRYAKTCCRTTHVLWSAWIIYNFKKAVP